MSLFDGALSSGEVPDADSVFVDSQLVKEPQLAFSDQATQPHSEATEATAPFMQRDQPQECKVLGLNDELMEIPEWVHLFFFQVLPKALIALDL